MYRPNKYGAKRTEYNGVTYHSKREAEFAQELDLRVKARDIAGWERQIAIPLVVNKQKVCTHIVDFLVKHTDGREELIEVKGVETAVYRLKKKLLEASYLAKHPKITYTVVR